MKKILFSLILIIYTSILVSQKTSFDLVIHVSISQPRQSSFKPDGRLFVFLNQNEKVEPRTRTWPSSGNFIFAKNFEGLDPNKGFEISNPEGWIKTSEWTFKNVPEGEYYLQVLWDQNVDESNINAHGNIYSEKQKVTVNQSTLAQVSLSKNIEKRELVQHELVKFIDLKSDTLSKWWGKSMYVKASVLLPSQYAENPKKAYPIRYNVAGYGGRYTRINRLVNNEEFMKWWQSDDAPQVINVFLDGEGPFGDSYQMDSDNSGPYGYSLIHELIPFIEKKYRNTDTAETRFVDGCSTGGWVSLGLQLYYPDTFNGVFSYSPDAIDFENYQLIDIYKDKNAFVNEHGYLRPVWRDTDGEPRMALQDFIQYENVLGVSNTYVTSGGQFSAHSALYSKKGADGLPKKLFDPITGAIDPEVAESWKKYDFRIYAEENWATLGPKLQGKIYIWMGDMDHFYLNIATRSFDQFLKTTKNPTSDAKIVFSPTKGHCVEFSNRIILEQIQQKLNLINQ